MLRFFDSSMQVRGLARHHDLGKVCMTSLLISADEISNTDLQDSWPCGPMDKASDYESGDSRFESWHGRKF